MSPEHLDAFRGVRGPTVDGRTDIYALGLVLFELLAGKSAFAIPPGKVADVVARMAADRRAGPPRLRALSPAVSPAAEAVVLKCLAPDFADRYPSAAALRDDLDRHLANKSLKYARNPSTRELFTKWTRRNPRLASAGSVGSAAAVLVVSAGLAAAGSAHEAAGYAAADRAAGFLKQRDAVVSQLGAGTLDPARLPAAAAAGRDALTTYAVLTDPDWADRPAVTRLSDATKTDVKEAAGEVLMLTARAAARAGDADQATQLNTLAVTCYPAGKVPAAVQAQAAALAGRPVPPPSPGVNPHELGLQAVDLLVQKRAHEALRFAKDAVEHAPGRSAAQFVLGVCHHTVGEYGKAEAAYSATLALDSTHYYARLNRGLARQQQADHAGAEADFSRAIRLRPEEADGYIHRAAGRRARGLLPAAVADLTTAIDLGSPPARAYLTRSQVNAQLGNAAASAADLAAGLRQTPTDAAGWVARAAARRATDPAGAADDLRRAITLDPASPNWGTNLAGVLSDDLNRPADGVAVLDGVIAAHPTFAPALVGRAVLHARLGDRPRAHADAAAGLSASRTAMNCYQAAGVFALTSRQVPADRERALGLLAEAFDTPGFDPAPTRTDRDLDALRADPVFVAMLAKAEKSRSPKVGAAE